MKTKIQLYGVISGAILLGVILGMNVGTIEAQTLKPTNPDVTKLQPKAYGSKTNVCGDQLCDESHSGINIEEHHNIGGVDTEHPAAPTVSLISIDKYQRGSPGMSADVTYKITYKLTAGTENLKDIQIHAQTDLGEWDFSISSLNSLKSSVNVARLQAMDPDSITGEIVHYTVVK